MDKAFNEIPGSGAWNTIKHIDKGWSNDQKYYIETADGRQLLLRVSNISNYDSKRREYASLKRLGELDGLISRPIDFGICSQGRHVYSLLTWIDGKDATEILPILSNEDQYKLGLKAGAALKKIHQISAPEGQLAWGEWFNRKIDRNIKAYQTCSIKFPDADRIITYIDANRHLLEQRPQTLQHGDYHVGNMLVTKRGELGIIDFNRVDYGDPWEEFNRITWCAAISPPFAAGRINGYFDDDVPDTFFRLMALYIGCNQLGCIPWAIPFGQVEIDTMLKQAKHVMQWYDRFQTYIPEWYKPDYTLAKEV